MCAVNYYYFVSLNSEDSGNREVQMTMLELLNHDGFSSDDRIKVSIESPELNNYYCLGAFGSGSIKKQCKNDYSTLAKINEFCSCNFFGFIQYLVL